MRTQPPKPAPVATRIIFSGLLNLIGRASAVLSGGLSCSDERTYRQMEVDGRWRKGRWQRRKETGTGYFR